MSGRSATTSPVPGSTKRSAAARASSPGPRSRTAAYSNAGVMMRSYPQRSNSSRSAALLAHLEDRPRDVAGARGAARAQADRVGERDAAVALDLDDAQAALGRDDGRVDLVDRQVHERAQERRQGRPPDGRDAERRHLAD